MPEKALVIDSVTIRFGGVEALRDVSLCLYANEILALVGPNGAGKTTLFNVASGFYAPNTGKVFFYGQDITGEAEYKISRKGLVRTFQNMGIFDTLTVLETVCIAKYKQLHGPGWFTTVKQLCRPWRQGVAEAKEIIKFVGLENYEESSSHNLSYGNQKKLEIARSLATNPRVIMLDEPAAGLNSGEKREIINVIRKVVERGISVLLVEHDVKLVVDISHRAAVLDYGQIIAEGEPGDVMRNEKVIAAYIGTKTKKQH